MRRPSAVREFCGNGSVEGLKELSRLSFAVVAASVEEKLRISFRDIRLPAGSKLSVADLSCKAYFGPAAAVTEGPHGHPDKKRLRELKMELHDGKAEIEVSVGVPTPQEPWAIRLKLYRRTASAFFAQEKVAEVVEVIPRPALSVQLDGPTAHSPPGMATLVVTRLVPETAMGQLREVAGSVLVRAIGAGVEADDIEELCVGIKEIGPDALLTDKASEALVTAAGMGKVGPLAKLLAAGVPASEKAARAAEKAHCLQLARVILEKIPKQKDQPEVPLILRALDCRLHSVAEQILEDDPGALNELPSDDGALAKKAHAAGAWSVLAALLSRGDPAPAPIKLLLDYALRAGNPDLAHACLVRIEGLDDMNAALRTCLDNGRLEIVREALEVQWRIRTSQWCENDSCGPPSLSLECGPADQPAECGVCFDPLFENPGIFLGAKGFRTCGHFVCHDCSEHIQDEAAERLERWRKRRDSRIPQPPGPVCPLCRAPFVSSARLADPTVDPRSFFRLSCVPEERINGGGADVMVDESHLRLTERVALGAMCAVLPVNSTHLAPRLKELWPSWCSEASAQGEPYLMEADFLKPGGMLAWVTAHLIEMKVGQQLGEPPRLQDDPTAWFHHFDYESKGTLTKPELLRGIAKVFDVGCLACPRTPARRKRTKGMEHLRELIDSVWDNEHWEKEGVPLADFVGRRGLAERLLVALPDETCASASSSPKQNDAANSADARAKATVEEALAKARARDFEQREEQEARAKERAEERRRVAAANGYSHMGHAGAAGGELLLASLLEAAAAANTRSSAGPVANIRVQCPFCSAINAAVAAPGHRVVCGGCRSVFAVPTAAPQ
eukprot:TRINITY_DN12113_c0_g1_i2.p1 TRINITY_DN12113_c0_g1~~TRINITY_DN12113_c0_g1_i2.p1  ORF type:complete len:866 (+),score=190.65 TRINITY_DN12113_c0_g1_i2:65-2599(+)